MELGIEGLTFEEQIGQGGFGSVYKARDEAHRRTLAVKILPKALDETARRRFDRERQAMGSLSGHPHIATIYTSGFTAQGEPYIVMELLRGGTLAERLETEPFTIEETRAIGIQLADALGAAHEAGVLHLDVKPENVIFDDHGSPKLVDFGISTLVDSEQTSTIRATPAFAAPEVLEGTRPTVAADVYSLGMMLYSMIQGNPYAGDSMFTVLRRIADEPIPEITRPDCPLELASLLRQSLAKDPAERPTDARAFSASLRAIDASRTPTAVDPKIVDQEVVDPHGETTTPDVETARTDHTIVVDQAVDQVPADTATPNDTIVVDHAMTSSDRDLGDDPPSPRPSTTPASTPSSASPTSPPADQPISPGASPGPVSAWRRNLAPIIVGAAIVVAIVIALAVVSVGGQSDSTSADTTTTSIVNRNPPTTRPTTAPPPVDTPPVFRLLVLDNGVGPLRWNSCETPIDIELNSNGAMTEAEEASLERFLIDAAFQLSAATGLTLRYSGRTDEPAINEYKEGPSMLIYFGEPGTGVLPIENSEVLNFSNFSTNRVVGEFTEIDHVNIQFNTSVLRADDLYFSGSGLTNAGRRAVLSALGQAMGLAYLSDTDMAEAGIGELAQRFNEVMYESSFPPPDVPPMLGPGDKLGLTELGGRINPCF